MYQHHCFLAPRGYLCSTSLMRTPLFCLLSNFSPPVHIARWAHMRCFLSVCHTFKNSSLELYHSMYLPLATLCEKFMSANGHCVIALTGRAHCQCKIAFFICLSMARILNTVHYSQSTLSQAPHYPHCMEYILS